MPTFNLYKSNSVFQVTVKRIHAETIRLDRKQLETLKKIQTIMYNDMLNIRVDLVFEDFFYGLFVVFLKSTNSSIDWDLMNELDVENGTIYSHLSDAQYLEKIIRENNLVKLKSNKNRIFAVKQIDKLLTASSKFPKLFEENTELTYIEFFKKTYDLETNDTAQPLVELTQVNFNLHFLLKTTNFKKDFGEKPKKYPEMYITEHVNIYPFKKNQIYTLIMLPAIIHRLSSLLKARKLKNLIENQIVKDLKILNVS